MNRPGPRERRLRWPPHALATLLASAACAAPDARLVLAPMQASEAFGTERAGSPAIDGGAPGDRDRARSLLGHWEGTGVQGDGTSWLMVVDVTSLKAGACAAAVYPTIPCTASWTCLADSDGYTAIAVERITEGKGECVDGGTMRLVLTPDGALDWSWAGAGETARGRLRLRPPP